MTTQTFARVEDGLVAELLTAEPLARNGRTVPGFALDGTTHDLFPGRTDWYPCPSAVRERWTASPGPDGAQSFAAPIASPVDLEALKDALKAATDVRAEDLRLTLITPGSGQAMEYQEAYAEAVAAQAAQETLAAGQALDPAKYPMLAASMGCDLDPTTGKPTIDIVGEARAVLAAYDAYQMAGAAIRGARLKGKAAIDAAAAAAAAQAAFAAITWPALA